jgi:ketosteroid isomerase-like protein
MPNPLSSEATVRRFIQSVQDRVDPKEIRAFFHPQIEQVEFPNRILPNGATRTAESMRDGIERGRQVLSSERYDVLNVIECGHQAVAEVTWEGTTAIALGTLPPGSVLKAHICQVFEFEDGLIRKLRNYDCYEPF